MTPLEVLRLQLRLEGLEIVNGDRLRQVEVVPGEDLPLMLMSKLADGQLEAYFDETLPGDLCQLLMEQAQYLQFPTIDRLANILVSRGISFQTEHFRTCLFPASFINLVTQDVECRHRSDPQVQRFGFGDLAEHVYIVERDGRVVSACVSVRENERCGDAWVYTDPEYRHQGLAGKVVSGWAMDLLSAGKVPFYSHKIGNTASARLAKSLGLLTSFEEIVISYTIQ